MSRYQNKISALKNTEKNNWVGNHTMNEKKN